MKLCGSGATGVWPASLSVFLSAILCVATNAYSVERTWVGASGGLWTDAANWDPAGIPGATDILVFAPQDTLSVRIGDGTSDCKAGGLRFESGTTYFAYMNSSVGIYMGNLTNTLYIAENATLVASNRFLAVSEAGRPKRLERSGGGTWSIRTCVGFGQANDFVGVDFIGGETIFFPEGGNYTFRDMPLNVHSGATVRCMANYRLCTAQPITVADGGLLDCGNFTQYMGSLLGDGVVTNASSITLYLNAGKCMFSGRIIGTALKFYTRPSGMSDEDWGFVIGASNTLAAVKLELPAGEGRVARFAAGVTNFYIKTVGATGASQELVLEDVDGLPVNVYGDNAAPAKLKLVGTGRFFHVGDNRTYDSTMPSLADFSGTLGSAGGKNINFGNGTAGGMPDLSTVSGIASLDTGSGLTFKYASEETPLAITALLYGAGNVTFFGHLAFSEVQKPGGCLYVRENADVAFLSGSVELDGYQIYFYDNSKLTLANGASMTAKAATLAYLNDWTALKHRPAFKVYSGAPKATLELANGAFASYQGSAPKSTTVVGGSTFEVGGGLEGTGTLTVDGGTLQLTTERSPTVLYTLFAPKETANFSIRVGAGGMSLRCFNTHYEIATGFNLYSVGCAVATGVDAGDDGGVVRTGSGTLFFLAPMTITGPFDNRDGLLQVPNKAALTGSSDPIFGFGDFRLGNSRLQYVDESMSTFTLRLATAAGKAMYYDGASTLRQKGSPARAKQNIEIGPSGAAKDASLVRGGRGAAFFLWNDIVAAGPADAGAVTVNGGLSTDTAGRIIAPVFHYVNGVGSASYDNTSLRRLRFLSCDAVGVLSAFTGETAGLSGGASSVAAITASTTLSENAAVAALRVDGVSGASPLDISSGAVLTVGDGTNPAVILLNNLDNSKTATIKGAGTLDFGTSEGVVAVNRAKWQSSPAGIECSISGSGGLSVVGPLDGGSHILRLAGDNTYTGGTSVNGARISPASPTAFSSGMVTLGDGDVAGGGLLMATEGLVVPNAMRIAGRGPIVADIDSSSTYGAVIFTKSGELSGSIDVYAPVRLCVRGEGVRGAFSGVLSGDSVQIWRSEGAVVFSGANTYTGGTEVVKSTLALAGNGTAGSGGIVLDRGTLRVENTAAKAIPNTVSGIGTLALAGSGAVTFESLASEDGRGFSLDVCGGDRELAGSLADIASITNSSSAHGVLTVASDGAWSGDVCPNVGIGVASGVRFRLGAGATLPADARIYLADGAALDLDGAERTVRTVYGNGTVVNGALNETNPRGGTLLIIM